MRLLGLELQFNKNLHPKIIGQMEKKKFTLQDDTTW